MIQESRTQKGQMCGMSPKEAMEMENRLFYECESRIRRLFTPVHRVSAADLVPVQWGGNLQPSGM